MAQNTINNNVVVAMSKEEVEMKTKDQIREMLGMVGVELSNTVFKKTRKADLVAMLEKYLVTEEKKEETKMVERNEKYEKLMVVIAKTAMKQTLKRDKNGKLVIRDYSLFFKPDQSKTDIKADYMVTGNRLWGVVAKCVEATYGKKYKTKENIDKTIEQMVAWDMLTKVCNQRTTVALNPSAMQQSEKDAMNALWRTKDITTEKTSNGMVKVVAVTDNGKAALNTMYPFSVYTATDNQMRTTYALSQR